MTHALDSPLCFIGVYPTSFLSTEFAFFLEMRKIGILSYDHTKK